MDGWSECIGYYSGALNDITLLVESFFGEADLSKLHPESELVADMV